MWYEVTSNSSRPNFLGQIKCATPIYEEIYLVRTAQALRLYSTGFLASVTSGVKVI